MTITIRCSRIKDLRGMCVSFSKDKNEDHQPESLAHEESNIREPQIIFFFVNGMLTGPREASLDALELGEFLGVKIHTIYNPTHGIIRDSLMNLWLLLGGKSATVALASKEIGEALDCGGTTVVAIAHSQGALVMNKAIILMLEKQRARMGIISLASPILIESNLGVLFVENLAVSADLIPKLAKWRRRNKNSEMILLESEKGVRFEHRFLGGTYQKSGWPRLKEIIDELKRTLKESNRE